MRDRVNSPDLKPPPSPRKDWRIAALSSAASTDPTRTRLNGVGLDHGHFFSTDGHRLMIVEKIDSLIGVQNPGRLYDTEQFKKGSLYPIDMSISTPLVNWKQILPDLGKARHVIEVDIPIWFKAVKSVYRGQTEAVPKIYFSETHGWSTKASGALFGINLGYLAPLAGLLGVQMYVIDPLSPITFKGDDWTYIIMPMRI